MTPATGRSGVGEHPLERVEVGRAGGIAVGDEGDLVELEAAADVRPQRRAVVRVDAAADQDPVAARRPTRHECRFGGRRRAVVVRRRHDVHVDELGDQRLVLVDRLERALADLGLVRRVGRVPLARAAGAGRRPAASSGGTRPRRGTTRGRSGCVRPSRAAGPTSSSSGSGGGQVERARPKVGRDVGEEVVDAVEAERREHPLAIGRGVRAVRHRPVSPPRRGRRRPEPSSRSSISDASLDA